jgi:hypothetical protein
MRLMFFLGESESFHFFQALFPAVGLMRLDSWMFITQKEILSQLGIQIDAWCMWCMHIHMKHLTFGNYPAISVFGSCDEHLFEMRDCVQL